MCSTEVGIGIIIVFGFLILVSILGGMATHRSRYCLNASSKALSASKGKPNRELHNPIFQKFQNVDFNSASSNYRDEGVGTLYAPRTSRLQAIHATMVKNMKNNTADDNTADDDTADDDTADDDTADDDTADDETEPVLWMMNDKLSQSQLGYKANAPQRGF